VGAAAALAAIAAIFVALKGFEAGGYTGAGYRSEVAGVVHRGEYVLPADVVRGNPAAYDRLRSVLHRGVTPDQLLNAAGMGTGFRAAAVPAASEGTGLGAGVDLSPVVAEMRELVAVAKQQGVALEKQGLELARMKQHPAPVLI